MNRKEPQAEILQDDENLFIVVDGVKIARRGQPNTPQAKTWVSLEPGWAVRDSADGEEIVVTKDGVAVH